VAVDSSANTLTFDRPIMTNYHVPITSAAGSVTGATPGTFYAFVTRGRSIGMVLVMGSRVVCWARRPDRCASTSPRPSTSLSRFWRFSYDMVLGHNVWEPNYFELTSAPSACPSRAE